MTRRVKLVATSKPVRHCSGSGRETSPNAQRPASTVALDVAKHLLRRLVRNWLDELALLVDDVLSFASCGLQMSSLLLSGACVASVSETITSTVMASCALSRWSAGLEEYLGVVIC